MRISRVKISNFANFSAIDVETGESKAGESNLVRALQMILDPGLSERDHQLGLEQLWDGLGEGTPRRRRSSNVSQKRVFGSLTARG